MNLGLTELEVGQTLGAQGLWYSTPRDLTAIKTLLPVSLFTLYTRVNPTSYHG